MNVTFNIDKLRKVVDYVGATQPMVEKQAQQEEALARKAPEVVEMLVQQGLLSPQLKEAKVRALVSNPIEILETLEKTAAMIVPPNMGSGAQKTAQATEQSSDQVFVDRIMG